MARKQKQMFFPTDPIHAAEKAAASRQPPKPAPVLKAQTPGQKVYIKKLTQNHHDILFAVGPAGTGKTYAAVLDAIIKFKNGECNKIIITRPNVGAGDDLGFLPGDINEKMAPWIAPLRDVFLEFFTVPEFRRLMDEEIVEIVPLCFIRGRTFKNAIIIADEAQNCTPSQMKALLTRIGEGSRMIVTGDMDQFERLEGGVSGLKDIVRRFENNAHRVGRDDEDDRRWSRIGLVRLGRADIVRHPVIDDVLELYGECD